MAVFPSRKVMRVKCICTEETWNISFTLPVALLLLWLRSATEPGGGRQEICLFSVAAN